MPLTRIRSGDIGIISENNYLSSSISNWTTYADAAGTSPVDGTGGSPTITFTQDSSIPLNYNGDFRLTNSAGTNRQGQGVSTDFTVENRHLGKVLQISLDYELVSGTLATNDIRLYIIQDPTGTPVVIEPVNTGLQTVISGSSMRQIASFQTHITLKNYRLCLHISSTSTAGYLVDFANFKVGEPVQSIGSIITDWQSYIPTFTNMGTVSSINTQWRRVGGSLEVRGNFTTGSVPVSGGMNFTLPGGLIPNVGWISGNGTVVGLLQMNDSNQANHVSLLARNDNIIRLGNYISSSGSIPLIYRTDANLVGSNTLVNFSLSVPIAGWGSSVAMSSDTGDSRVVAARYTNPTTSGSVLVYQTRDYDTHGAYSNGVFTAPVNGYYRFSATIRGVFNSQWAVQIDEVTYTNAILDMSTGGYSLPLTDTVFLRANQRLRIIFNAGSLSNAITSHAFAIERIPAGSQVIASSETVAARYTTDTAQNNDIIKCEDKDFDTHNAYSITTGKYTVPISGVYRISGQITNYNSGYLYADIRKNNDVIICRDLIQLSSASYMTASPNLVTKLIAGDTVWLWAYTSGTMQVDTGYRNMFCIERIGL